MLNVAVQKQSTSRVVKRVIREESKDRHFRPLEHRVRGLLHGDHLALHFDVQSYVGTWYEITRKKSVYIPSGTTNNADAKQPFSVTPYYGSENSKNVKAVYKIAKDQGRHVIAIENYEEFIPPTPLPREGETPATSDSTPSAPQLEQKRSIRGYATPGDFGIISPDGKVSYVSDFTRNRVVFESRQKFTSYQKETQVPVAGEDAPLFRYEGGRYIVYAVLDSRRGRREPYSVAIVVGGTDTSDPRLPFWILARDPQFAKNQRKLYESLLLFAEEKELIDETTRELMLTPQGQTVQEAKKQEGSEQEKDDDEDD